MAAEPRLLPALIVGAGTVVAPLCLMQPAMGLRFSAHRAGHSFLTHLVFGAGLYAAGRFMIVVFN